MASIVSLPNGNHRVDFTDDAGKRHRIRIGKTTLSQAEFFANRVESLLSGRITDTPPDVRTSQWIAQLPRKIRERLATAGLCSAGHATTLSGLVAALFVEFEGGESTRRNITLAANNLLAFFGHDRQFATINKAEAKRYRSWLFEQGGSKGEPLAEATVSRRLRRAMQIFKVATDNEWMPINPFHGVEKGSEANRERDFFVDAELFNKILDAIPDADFRAFLALMRFGGLRFCEVHQSFQWSWIDWNRGRINIASPKTGNREIPIFKELRPWLEEAFEVAKPGIAFPQLQATRNAIAKRLTRIGKKIGVLVWPKPFQNLRATRETELLEKHPIHVVTAWMGHSIKIALLHYAQISPEHWQKADGTFSSIEKPEPKNVP